LLLSKEKRVRRERRRKEQEREGTYELNYTSPDNNPVHSGELLPNTRSVEHACCNE
jgi:hypothetical protein